MSWFDLCISAASKDQDCLGSAELIAADKAILFGGRQRGPDGSAVKRALAWCKRDFCSFFKSLFVQRDDEVVLWPATGGCCIDSTLKWSSLSLIVTLSIETKRTLSLHWDGWPCGWGWCRLGWRWRQPRPQQCITPKMSRYHLMVVVVYD